jgi:MFS family permease
LFQVYMPVYGYSHGLSASQIGMVLAMAATGGFAARIVLMRLIAWSSEEKVLALALCVGAFGFAAVPFFQSAVALGIIAIAFGFGMNCTQPITLSLLYTRSPQGRAGEALGLRFTTDNAARLVSPGIYGVVAAALGVSAVFWINALVLGCGGLLSRHGSDKRKRVRDEA